MPRAARADAHSHFRADLGSRLPDVATLPGVLADHCDEEELEAEYLDTEDLRLLRAGIRLRRCTGGRAAGWHLRVPHPVGGPIEVHQPSSSPPEEPPGEVRALLAARLRDQRLGRVARVLTRRQAHRLVGPTGATVAEVVDEEITAKAEGEPAVAWRELRVGGRGGELGEAVASWLGAVGARPVEASDPVLRAFDGRADPEEPPGPDRGSTAGEVLQAYLREQAEALVALDPAVRVDAEDAVHKMRVAARRLRSVLAAYRRLVDREVTEPLREELKWLGGVLGPVRDAEVIRAHLRRAVEQEPPEAVLGGGERLDDRLAADHDAARRAALAALSSDRYLRLLDRLDHVGDAVGGRRAAQRAPKGLAREVGRAHRRMRRILDEALDSADPAERARLLHEVRKAVKRARYAADCGTPALGARAKALAARMEHGQELLGDHQDSIVIRDLLRQVALDVDAAGESAFTLGRLHAGEEQRGRAAAAAFLDEFASGWAQPPSWLR